MKTLSKKHWIAFFIIVTIYISFFMLVSSTYTSMFGAIFESLLCIFLIHNFLKESLEEYIYSLVEYLETLELEEGLLKNKYDLIKIPLQIDITKEKIKYINII